MARLMTTLSVEDANTLVQDKILLNSELNSLDGKFSSMLKRRIEELTGLNEGVIVCVQRIEDLQVSLSEHYSDLYDFLNLENKTLILELKVDNTLCLSIGFDDYIVIRNKIENEKDEVLLDLLYEDLCDLLKLGKLTEEIEDENVITFLPSLELSYCKMFLLLDEDWEGNDYDLGDVPQLKLKRMEL